MGDLCIHEETNLCRSTQNVAGTIIILKHCEFYGKLHKETHLCCCT